MWENLIIDFDFKIILIHISRNSIFLLSLLFASFGVPQSVATIYICNFFLHSYWGYSCEFESISYLDQSEEFIIDGLHVEGFYDADVLTVFTTFANMSYIPKELLPKFGNIANLLVSQSRMESIDGAFGLCDKLEIMTFYRNNLRRIESRTFEMCKNLRSLDFGENQIAVVPVDAFEGITKLESLGLYNNPITVLDPGTFDKLVNIELLWLLDLDVPEMPPQLLRNLKKLKRFQFGTKAIQSVNRIRTGSFKSLPALEYVQVMSPNGEVMEIEPAAFEDLESLGRLDLYSNAIQRLNSDAFVNVINLLALNIQYNQITEVERSFFSNFPKLVEVLTQENLCVNENYYIESPLDVEFLLDFEECFSKYDDSTTSTVMETTQSTTQTTEKTDDTTQGTSSVVPSFLCVLGFSVNYFVMQKNRFAIS